MPDAALSWTWLSRSSPTPWLKSVTADTPLSRSLDWLTMAVPCGTKMADVAACPTSQHRSMIAPPPSAMSAAPPAPSLLTWQCMSVARAPSPVTATALVNAFVSIIVWSSTTPAEEEDEEEDEDEDEEDAPSSRGGGDAVGAL